jgi:hypothetical protein
MRLGRLFGVFPGVEVVRVGEMRVMASIRVLALFVMFGCFTMVFGCLLVMLGGLLMMFGGPFAVLWHLPSPRCPPGVARRDYARARRQAREGLMLYQ